MSPDAHEKLRLAHQLLGEALDVPDSPEAQSGADSHNEPEFTARCAKCARPIHWAPTERGKKVALDDRSGPYVIANDGTAIFEGFGGFAYHYDGTSEGCPAQIQDKREENPPREWQSVYD